MKSGKQKRQGITKRRIKKAKAHIEMNTHNISPTSTIPADHKQLEHVGIYSFLPDYYEDKPFICRDCGVKGVWTAKQQKWWYEIAKGHIDSKAVRCLSCRKKIRAKKDSQKKHMEEIAQKTPHPNEIFFAKRYSFLE